MSVSEAISSGRKLIGADFHNLSDFLQKLPLADLGIAWVIPAAAGALLAGFTFGIIEKWKKISSGE